jgi:hypothetical protein
VRGKVDVSRRQLQYNSQDADSPSCFLARLAGPSPGRHPAHESTPSRRERPMPNKIDHVPTIRRAPAIRSELAKQRRLRLRRLENLRVNAAEVHATAAPVWPLHTGETNPTAESGDRRFDHDQGHHRRPRRLGGLSGSASVGGRVCVRRRQRSMRGPRHGLAGRAQPVGRQAANSATCAEARALHRPCEVRPLVVDRSATAAQPIRLGPAPPFSRQHADPDNITAIHEEER